MSALSIVEFTGKAKAHDFIACSCRTNGGNNDSVHVTLCTFLELIVDGKELSNQSPKISKVRP